MIHKAKNLKQGCDSHFGSKQKNSGTQTHIKKSKEIYKDIATPLFWIFVHTCRDVFRTMSNIKMKRFAKIVNS